MDSSSDDSDVSDTEIYDVRRKSVGGTRDTRRRLSNSPTDSTSTMDSSVGQAEFNDVCNCLKRAERERKRLEEVNGDLEKKVVSLEKGII